MLNQNQWVFLACILLAAPAAAQAGWSTDADDAWVTELLAEHPDDFAILLDAPDSWRVQIAVGEIECEGTAGAARLVQLHPYRLEAEYEYPASAIKTVGALAALRTLERLRALPGNESLSVDSRLLFDDLRPDLEDAVGAAVVVSERGRTTLRAEIEGALIPSSNDSFNRLYDFAGHEDMNTFAWAAGLPSIRVQHRLSRQGLPEAAHRLAPRVSADLGTGEIELLPLRNSTLEMSAIAAPRLAVGSAYRAPLTGEHVDEPLDFSDKNAASLSDLLAIVAWVVDPQLVPGVDLGLDDDHRALLGEVMGRVPDDSDRFEPFSPGVTQVVPWDRLRYVNKAGRAYGFHLDAAYVEDTSTGCAFLLAAAIHVNPDGVMNDDRYAYEEVSYPFLSALGRAVAERLLGASAATGGVVGLEPE